MNLDTEKLAGLREQRNAAQAELERYLLEQFPIDSEEKVLGVTKRRRVVNDIEEDMRELAITPAVDEKA